MDSHEIPLALLEKLQDLLPVRFAFSGRCNSGIVAESSSGLCARPRRKPQDPCDLAFAHLLRVQFQNRGALCLAQHAVSPVEVFVDAAELVLNARDLMLYSLV